MCVGGGCDDVVVFATDPINIPIFYMPYHWDSHRTHDILMGSGFDFDSIFKLGIAWLL